MGLPCFLSPILHLIQAPFLVQFLPTIIDLDNIESGISQKANFPISLRTSLSLGGKSIDPVCKRVSVAQPACNTLPIPERIDSIP